MRPVTDQFLATVRGSHQMASRATIVVPGQTGVTPTGIEIPIISGDVKLDSTADIRASLDLVTFDQDWTAALDDALTPYGNEIFIERGIVYGDDSTEWVSQGYYRIYSVDQQQAPKGSLSITARDRMSGIVDARPLAPMEFGEGTSVSSVFDFLIGEVYPDPVIVFDFDAGVAEFPSSHVLEDDRYKFLKDICDALGKVMYWDYAGRLQVCTAPDPTDPVFDVNHGPGGVVTAVSRSLSRDGVYNALVATGEPLGEDPPVRGIALDENQNSPTYWDGPFGKVPEFYSSSFLTTEDQCVAAAEAMLLRQLGVPYSVDFEMAPNVALEPLDPVQLTYDDRLAPEIHVIESLTIPLDPGATMQATTRQQIRGGLTG
jgi:hypothetical protein